MKKNYITPEINVIQLEALCNEGFKSGSVLQGSTKGDCISKFDVVNGDATKTLSLIHNKRCRRSTL